jgi:hypothetical protein
MGGTLTLVSRRAGHDERVFHEKPARLKRRVNPVIDN